MNRFWQTELRSRYRSTATFLPPASVEEAAWDILLALGSDDRCELKLEKLAGIVSLPETALIEWLAVLERRRLITGIQDEVTTEVRAALTPDARELLDRYFSATSDLQVSAHH
jgi:hypothetical protein